MGRLPRSIYPLLLASLMLTACGGSSDQGSTSTNGATSIAAQEPNAPQATGNTATDGFNWFNFRRRQIGLEAVARNGVIDVAAQGHSNYQRTNNIITHDQSDTKAGFTGRTVGDRFSAAGYGFASASSYAYGEVISATSDPSGFNAAEDLIAAIYHRFVILEPMFKEAGSGAATVSGGLTYFTTNFAANGLDRGVARGSVVTYPASSQAHVRRNFFSDNESPDPVPGRNEVGYPVSVHANITSTLTVQSFTIRPRGGSANLTTRLLTAATDPQTPASAAAAVPLDPLLPLSTYDVQFVGKVDGTDVNRSWSFTTQ
ncbi:CAP domain-containing protein [Noviherbaspirillum saxi]|uniref:CAP domain-containing protein n=1 Tax=Noviherbaspirillum saxi TaxID=2320863 RepID=A0A3A3FM39_9BURK|nr:CAP domain-containing protein [Noviherbaspirillum saxi]RJF97287.1 CAP domain-containing protein [Noviherbaspirillum saxi]